MYSGSGGSSRRWIIAEIEHSLRRLGTDHIDLYQVHHPDPRTDIEETLSALTDLVRSGKVRAFGSSNVLPPEIVEAQWIADRRGPQRYRTKQPLYSIIDRSIEREVLSTCQRYGMGVLVWSPPAMGMPTGHYRKGQTRPRNPRMRWVPRHLTDERKFDAVEQLIPPAEEAGLSLTNLAMAFATTHLGVTSAIIGPRTTDHLEDLLAGAVTTLDDAVPDRIDEIAAPETTLGPLDAAYTSPAITRLALRRHATDERAAA